MTSQPDDGLQKLQYTYCRISEEVTAVNQAMKFSQLIEYS